ncbi:threonine aldolase family protein [Martelella mediterranea]|uniref:L-threonine aldolase n=1 Tax=Martelella mediterranea TaxID=293089 RepID=A0A4V2V3C3_9HYPH|nr:low specificity L-threonine aldolase [Martelella mediterranea]TCT31097.1 L-threonine aldolase [Martelella mediterranea]
MFFASDNWSGAHPAIGEALIREQTGYAAAYGTSALDRRIEQRFNEIFEREVAVYFVGTGTAANSLGLSAFGKPGGVVFCHAEAHIANDEGGAPEFFASGGRLAKVAGPHGKMIAQNLEDMIARYPASFIHAGQPAAVSLTQSTEIGTVYGLDEIDALTAVARRHGLPVHMDGARFANALAALDVSPAEMTWKRGVDLVSFGGTKNGCWCAEAIVFMNPDQAKDMPYIRKRAAHLFSKTRFIAAQFDGYLTDNLWLDLARHANRMADRLRAAFRISNRARLAWETQSNEVFIILPKASAGAARAAGANFYDWLVPVDQPGLVQPDEVLARCVTSFATREEEIDQFVSFLGEK